MRPLVLSGMFLVLILSDMFGWRLGWETGVSAKNAFLLLLALLVLLDRAIARDRMPGEVRRTLGLFLGLVVMASLSLGLASLGAQDGGRLSQRLLSVKGLLVDHLLFFIVYLYGPRNLQEAMRTVTALVALVIAVNILTLVDAFDIPDLGIIRSHEGRVSGPLGEPNQYAAVSAMFVPVLGALMLGARRVWRIAYGGGLLVTLALLLATGSRGGVVGLVGGIAAGAWLFRKELGPAAMAKGTLVFGTLFAVAVALAGIRYSGVMEERVAATTERQTVTAVSSGRLMIWQKGLEIQAQEPLSFVWGKGWDSFTRLTGQVSHNTFMEVLFNLGLVGLGLLLAVIRGVVNTSVRRVALAQGPPRAVLIGFVMGFAALCGAVFFVNLYSAWFLVWAYAGAATRVAVEVGRTLAPAATRPAPMGSAGTVVRQGLAASGG